jgi:hypothetical protein
MPFEGIIKLKIVANYDDMGFDRRKKEGENMCSFSSFLLGSETKNFSPINGHLKAEKNGRHAKNKDSDPDKDDHNKGRGGDERKGKGKK